MWIRFSLAAAFVICSVLGAYAFYDHNIAETTARQHLRELKQRHQLPVEFRDVDIETVDLTKYDLELPGVVMFRQNIAYFLAVCWYMWVPTVALICFVLAWLSHLVFKYA